MSKPAFQWCDDALDLAAGIEEEEWPERAYTQQLVIQHLRGLAEAFRRPCGECHPCDNWRGEMLRRDLRAVHEGAPTMACPQCGDVRADMDGFGTTACLVCGWCSHPSSTGGLCDICGVREVENVDTRGRT